MARSKKLLQEIRQRSILLDPHAYQVVSRYATAISHATKEFYGLAYVTVDPEAISESYASVKICYIQHARAVLRASGNQIGGSDSALEREFAALLPSGHRP